MERQNHKTEIVNDQNHCHFKRFKFKRRILSRGCCASASASANEMIEAATIKAIKTANSLKFILSSYSLFFSTPRLIFSSN